MNSVLGHTCFWRLLLPSCLLAFECSPPPASLTPHWRLFAFFSFQVREGFIRGGSAQCRTKCKLFVFPANISHNCLPRAWNSRCLLSAQPQIDESAQHGGWRFSQRPRQVIRIKCCGWLFFCGEWWVCRKVRGADHAFLFAGLRTRKARKAQRAERSMSSRLWRQVTCPTEICKIFTRICWNGKMHSVVCSAFLTREMSFGLFLLPHSF